MKEKNGDKKALQLVADRLAVEPEQLKNAICKTVAPDIKTESQFLSFIAVANAYRLNPLRGEITAFSTGKGGVKPVVPIDGWISIVNKQKNFDGVELTENCGPDKNKSGTTLESVTAKFYLKDTSHPITITEYMEECYNGDKSPWKQWPRRMLRHKAYIQGARIAFGLSGIYDEDEGERIIQAEEMQEAQAIKEPQPKEPGVTISGNFEPSEENILEMVKKAEEIADENAPEQPETPQRASPEKAEKRLSKSEIVDLIDKLAKKNPKEITTKDLRPAFQGIKQILSEEEMLDVFNSFSLTDEKEIKSAGVAIQILQICVGRINRGKGEN